MIILPAIDIKDGECVRLYKGDFGTTHKVAENALETALSFKSAGAEWLHTVDLNGALSGKRVNSDIFVSFAENSGLKVELGGGIRTFEDIKYYIERGISRVVIGSAAIKDPPLVREAVKAYGEKIAVGIDAKDGYAAAGGWLDVSEIYFTELAKNMEDCGVETIFFTDISRDGTIEGPNIERLSELPSAVKCNIIASGGISGIDDIAVLKELGVYGAICGKSIYSGSLDLKAALKLCEE